MENDNKDTHKKADLTTVRGRLLEFLRSQGITRKVFSEKMGLSLNYVGAIRKSLPADRMRKMMELYPQLNRDWLLYGEGEMLLKSEPLADKCDLSAYEIPLLPVEAAAGTLQLISEGVMRRDCDTVVSPLRGAEMAIRVSGDSMEPLFSSGDTLLIKRINEKSYIPWGNAMVIDTGNGVLVKSVFPGHSDASIEARSKNPAYPPIDVPKSTIYGLYKILGRISVYASM